MPLKICEERGRIYHCTQDEVSEKDSVALVTSLSTHYVPIVGICFLQTLTFHVFPILFPIKLIHQVSVRLLQWDA